MSRVRAHLRRRRLDSTAGQPTQKLEFPGLEVDLLKREVKSQNETASLTAKEFEVLALLASQVSWGPLAGQGRAGARRRVYDANET